MKRGRDDPAGLTAREALEDIAAFPLRKEFERVNGDISGSSWTEGYAAFRNQQFAKAWLDANPKRR